MSPEAIPWILCGSLCLLPALIGSGVFYSLSLFLNRYPTRDTTTYLDDDGRKHVVTEWAMLTREEKRLANTTTDDGKDGPS